MLQADGDVGASLLAAASGLRGRSPNCRSLDDDRTDGIFAPRAGKDRRFYQALERFNAARAAIREKELRSDAWVKLNNEHRSSSATNWTGCAPTVVPATLSGRA